MIRPTTEDIRPLNDFKVIDFQNWLYCGLNGFLLNNEDVWAFEPMELFVGQDEHLVLDLRNIYDALPTRVRANFRQAVANLIATLDSSEENVEIFEHLLHLTSVISAGAEVFPVLPAKVGNGFFGLSKNREGKSLFDATITTVANLAAPTLEAKECLYALIGSRYFEIEYSALALVSLCRTDDNLAEHLKLLRNSLHAMFEKCNVSQEAKFRIAENVMNCISTYKLSEELEKISIVDPERNWCSSDNWLLEALTYTEDKPPLIQHKLDDGLYIFRSDKPDIAFEIKEQPRIPFMYTVPLCIVAPSSTPKLSSLENDWISETEDVFSDLFYIPFNYNQTSRRNIRYARV